MKARKPLAILAATAITGFGLTALATPASASTTVTINGTAGPPATFQALPSSIAGTSVTLNNISGEGLPVVSQFLSDGDGACSAGRVPTCIVGPNGTATFDIAPGADGASVSLQFNFIEVATFTVTYPNSSATGSSATGSTPAPVIQQFEKPATGSCDEAEPEGLDWGGAASGGWGESWAQWANEGQGGPVCTRTLEYNNSTATWQVQ